MSGSVVETSGHAWSSTMCQWIVLSFVACIASIARRIAAGVRKWRALSSSTPRHCQRGKSVTATGAEAHAYAVGTPLPAQLKSCAKVSSARSAPHGVSAAAVATPPVAGSASV